MAKIEVTNSKGIVTSSGGLVLGGANQLPNSRRELAALRAAKFE